MLKIISTEVPRNHNYDLPPAWWRNLNARKATALDADRNPHLAKDWPGLLLVGGKLAYNDNIPEARRLVERLTADREERPGPIISVHWPLPGDE